MQDIIVVEGIHDVQRIKSVYKDANCIITNGREIDPKTIETIKKLSETHRIIVFTDPDTPGEKIRQIIMDNVPEALNAFLRKKDCISHNKKKVGIEHASKESIIKALENVYQNKGLKETITMSELYILGLNGTNSSRILRNKISDYLNIGMPNCKTFLSRLNLLQIDKKRLEEIICLVK